METVYVTEAYVYCTLCPDRRPLGLVLHGPEGFFHPPDVELAVCPKHGLRTLEGCRIEPEAHQRALV